MCTITIVYSAHRENGLCNAEELLTILRAIGPDVVFEEMHPSDVDAYYKHGTKRSLEAHAVARFRENRSLQQVPVDRFEVPEHRVSDLKRDFDRVFDHVEQASQEYRRLDEERDESIRRLGFPYLNGEAFANMTLRMSAIEDEIVSQTGDQALIRGLATWRQMNERREAALVGNIYDYCRKNVFVTGVFLVGAAHRIGVLREIEKSASIQTDLIDWHVTYNDPGDAV